jgi:hypothetical protein
VVSFTPRASYPLQKFHLYTLYRKLVGLHNWSVWYGELEILNSIGTRIPFSRLLNPHTLISVSYVALLLLGLGRFFCLLFYTQSVGILGRWNSLSQGLYLHTGENQENNRRDIHSSSGIRTRYPSTRAGEDNFMPQIAQPQWSTLILVIFLILFPIISIPSSQSFLKLTYLIYISTLVISVDHVVNTLPTYIFIPPGDK